MDNKNITQDMLPEKYRPLGMWAYFGYTILFSIPLLGFIFLIIYSFSDKNINRRNFARSYFCVFILMVIIYVICMILFELFYVLVHYLIFEFQINYMCNVLMNQKKIIHLKIYFLT